MHPTPNGIVLLTHDGTLQKCVELARHVCAACFNPKVVADVVFREANQPLIWGQLILNLGSWVLVFPTQVRAYEQPWLGSFLVFHSVFTCPLHTLKDYETLSKYRGCVYGSIMVQNVHSNMSVSHKRKCSRGSL